ncbi:hypothetical protein CHH28_00945 [Bacterioplanes sanyensis]|uniref:DUF6160 domain-containing protein n=1 Tax=Bacterioplanes sanyensis TaxID=1249553 RepID=A0A222FE17_9GAMM|nr:DUF6160 family protein [Bacterioplanes sanyensis]ASP37335.1 hypothetical protein CHH28_00945 [Bacterioplanes sanyensis]
MNRIAALWLLPLPALALQPLSDHSLSTVTGQSGITLEQSGHATIGEITYIDDGNQLQIQNLERGDQNNIALPAQVTHVTDVAADGTLSISTTISPTALAIGGIRINDSLASSGAMRLNYSGNTHLQLRPSSSRYIEGQVDTSISDAELIWTTNGHSISFDDILFRADIDQFSIGDAYKGAKQGLDFELNQFAYDFSTGGLKLGGVSLGTLSGELALSGGAQLYAGGRLGSQGIELDAAISIINDTSNYVQFVDDGNALLMGDFNGSLNISGLTLDVANDHLAIGVDQLDGAFNANRILIGDSTRPLGAVQFEFLMADDSANNRFNRLRLYPGVRQPVFAALPADIRPYASQFYQPLNNSSDGLSAGVDWNLSNANASYIDDNRLVVVSGIKSHGSGDVTFDVRGFDHDNNSATADKTVVAIGLNRFQGSYGIDGLRVGNKTAPLQGGAELLLSLEVFQAMDFNLDAYTYITAGGVSGGGIQMDGDYLFSDTNIGLSVDENGQGIWATGVTYEIHMRQFQFDVSNRGISVNRGEQWSTMNIDDLRWGDKVNGRSLGRVTLERFEKGSSLEVLPGGAGAVCVGASAGSQSACDAAGGRWEDRGEEGLTVALKAAFEPEGPASDGSIARNRLTWENNRTSDGNGGYVNGTGTRIEFDGISTNDGLGNSDSNNYGFRADLNIDVYETKVVKKSDGLDSEGKPGSKGDELIYTDSTRTDYNYVANPSDLEKQLRPLGFAVQGNVSFKDFQIDQVRLGHPTGGVETVFSGIVLQNMDVTTNLTATPIR